MSLNTKRMGTPWAWALAGIWLASACGGADGAEKTAPRAYTLEECLDIGLERSTAIANAGSNEKIAQGKIRQVRAQVLPQLSASASYTREDGVETSSFGDQTVEVGSLNNYAASANASQLLFSGGSVEAALRAARLYRDRSLLGTARSREAMVRDIRLAFNGILLAKENVKVQEASGKQLQGFVDQVEAKFKNSTASEFDLLSARVRLANQTPILIKARRDVEVQKEAFRTLIQLDERDYEIEGELIYRPEELDLDALQAAGLKTRNELKEQEKLIGLWKQDIRAEKGNFFPTVRARGSYLGQNPASYFSGDDEWDWGWNAGLTAEWSVLDGGLRNGKLLEKGMELEKAKRNYSEMERQVRLEVKEAYLDMEHAGQAVLASRDNVELAEKSLAIAKTRYDAGLATYLEFTDTNLALSEARLTWWTAILAHMNALNRLRYACGLTRDQTFEEGLKP